LRRGWELGWWVAKSDCRKAHASSVLGRPAVWAFLPFGVFWLFTWLAKVKLSKAVAVLIRGGVQRLTWPARVVALAVGGSASWAKVLADCRRWNLLFALDASSGGANDKGSGASKYKRGWGGHGVVKI